jgi:hypothetical protein
MIKATQPDGNAAEPSPIERANLECWNRDAQAQALRVEVSEEQCFVFPYSHFAWAGLSRDGKAEVLRVSFTTHDVHISGRNLRLVLVALQKLSVEWVSARPARYERLATTDAVFIEKIEVEELSEEPAS